jgi:hypothetical protein
MDNVRMLADNDRSTWPQKLISVQFAHNSAPNQTTGLSPHEIVFGTQPLRPENLLLQRLQERKNPQGVTGSFDAAILLRL